MLHLVIFLYPFIYIFLINIFIVEKFNNNCAIDAAGGEHTIPSSLYSLANNL